MEPPTPNRAHKTHVCSLFFFQCSTLIALSSTSQLHASLEPLLNGMQTQTARCLSQRKVNQQLILSRFLFRGLNLAIQPREPRSTARKRPQTRDCRRLNRNCPDSAECRDGQHTRFRKDWAVLPLETQFAFSPFKRCFSWAHLGQPFKRFHQVEWVYQQSASVSFCTEI